MRSKGSQTTFDGVLLCDLLHHVSISLNKTFLGSIKYTRKDCHVYHIKILLLSVFEISHFTRLLVI